MKYTWLSRKLRDQRGAVLIMVAGALLALMAFTALAIDIGYAFVVKNELQNVSDAAALAGVRYIGNIYEGLTYQEQQSYSFNRADIVASTQAIALQNKAGGLNINIADVDIEIGKWNPQTKQLYDIGNMTSPDALRVRSRRDSTVNTPISTFFARVIGINTLDVSAPATAALTGQSTSEAGGLPIPLGVSQVVADGGGWCGDQIVLHPTKTSCAGWHTFTTKSSANRLEQILNDYLPSSLRRKKWQGDDLFVSPEVRINDTMLYFQGGDIASNFEDLENLFNYMKTRDGDGKADIWTTSIVIYKEEGTSCGNPNQIIPIVGFATMEISMVVGPSTKTVFGKIICDIVDAGKSGGGNYGTKGTIPGLVQ